MKRIFLTETGKVKPCCLTCKNFAYWDGDYCCVPNFLILQDGICKDRGGYHDPAWMTSQLEKNMKFANDCPDYETSEHPFSGDYVKEYKRYRELQNKIEELQSFLT